MSDRSVSVNLKANVAGYIAGIEQAKLKTADFAKSTSKNAAEHKESWDKVGKGMMLTGGVIAVGVGLAVKAFADFDKEMSGVKAVSGATTSEMDKLGKAAIKAGQDTKYSASEAAKAEAELAKAGISTSDILGGALTGSLNLAAAGNLDLAEAATISAKAMKIFSLEGKDVGHIADVLAAGANKSAADVTDLGQAMAQGGLIAAQTGLTLEETVGTLSAFADNALMGSDAGTSMKTMLMRLNPQSDEAAGLMDELGLRAYDANGQFVGMAAYAGKLQTGLAGLSDEQRNAAMTTLFGSDAVRGANILYKIGAEGVRDYTAAVNDEGAAARMAAIMMDNLAGDFEQLQGSIETALIQAGSGGNDALRSLTQTATDAVNWFGQLEPATQKTALGFAAVTAGGLLTVGALITILPKIQATKAALRDMEITTGRTGSALKSLGKVAGAAAGIYAIATAAAALGNAMQDAVPGVEATTEALIAGGSAASDSLVNIDGLFKGIKSGVGPGTTNVDDLTSAFARLTNKQGLESFTDRIDSMVGKVNSAEQSAEVFNNIGVSLGELVNTGYADLAGKQFDAMAKKLGLTKEQLPELLKLMPAYSEAVAGAANETTLAGLATDGAVGPTKALAESEKDVTAAAEASKKAHDALIDSITGYGSAMLTARGDARSYEAAIDAATASLKENGRTLDIGTEKGRANQAALDGIATSALKVAESNLTAAEANNTLGAASKTVTGDINSARTAFINQAVAMGMPKRAAEALAIQSGLTAGRVKEITDNLAALGQQNPKPKVTVNAAQAHAEYKALQAERNALRDKTVTITWVERGRTVGGSTGPAVATGGYIRGPGTGTSDSIPARLSDGEFVIRAAAVKKIGTEALHRINSYASGGMVTPRYVSAPARSGASVLAPAIAAMTQSAKSGGAGQMRLAKADLDYLADRMSGGIGGALTNAASSTQHDSRNRVRG